MEELRALNPQYRRDIIPMGYALRLPSSAIEQYVTHEVEIATTTPTDGSIRRPVVEDPETWRQTTARNNKRGRNIAAVSTAGAKYHTVRSNETLGSIAQKYHTSVKALQRLNGMGEK